MSKNEFVNLGHARHDDQLEVMRGIIDDGVCPFCIESLRKYHKQPILDEGDHWIVTTNQWPYENTKAHYLLIARQHIQTVTELPSGAFEEFGDHIKRLIEKDNMPSGGVAMRFGKVEEVGGTVEHLHGHLLQPKDDLTEDQKLKFKFSR